METRRTRGKRIKYDTEYVIEPSDLSDSNDQESLEDLRKSKIRDSNKEYAKRMTILQTWSDFWSDYTTREGDAYPKKEAQNILKKSKKILCPIESCRKAFTSFGGLRYHYARCNIERCFKCNVCKPPSELKTKGDLLRHMIRSHYETLPNLEGEQKEIANSYLNSTGRVDKSKKRNFSNDHETNLNCKLIVKAYYDMLERVFQEDNYSARPFREWQTLVRDWEYLAYSIDRRRYIPPEKESPHIKISANSWCTLKAGESMLLNHNGETSQIVDEHIENVIYFTGGVSTSAAWLPKPLLDESARCMTELIAVSVNCCPMDKNLYYKDCMDLDGCLQFWTMQISTSATRQKDNSSNPVIMSKPILAFMVGHNWGNIFEMNWCPLGTSWEPPVQVISNEIKPSSQLPRLGLLALACGDGQIRIISVPHSTNLLHISEISNITQKTESLIDLTPMYRVKPIACLAPPGAGQSSDFQTPACTSICWNLEDNQRLIVAGYSNGTVALFDLANYSPILYSSSEHYHIYRPYRTWFAHGMPVSGVALLSNQLDRTLIATGSRDKQLKIWNSMDLDTCLHLERSPITGVVWDYRFRGVVSSTEAAFTSYQNRVNYKFPVIDGGNTTLTIATHRASVWGLCCSIITSSVATSDEAGEVFVAIYGRPVQKKDRNPLSTHSMFTVVPRARCPAAIAADMARQQITARCSVLYDHNTSGLLDSSSRTALVTQEHKNDSAVDDNQGGAQIGGDMMSTSNGTSNVLITTMQPAIVIEGPIGGEIHTDNIDLDLDENNEDNQHEDVYGLAERPVANKPSRFLLPIDHRAVDTFGDFKQNFGLEYVKYDQTYPRRDQKLPESCARANDLTKIYCDRVCDYPFSSIKHVSFSPNTGSFPYLMTVSHIGLCRVDKVKLVEQVYKTPVDSLSEALLQKHRKQDSFNPATSISNC